MPRAQDPATNTPPAGPEGVPPYVPVAVTPGTIVFSGNGTGTDVRFQMNGDNLVLTQGENSTTIPIQELVPRGAVQLSWAFATCVIAVFIGWPIARAVARYIDRRGHAARSDHAMALQQRQRVEQLERNIDTVAVELERLSEAQRFTTKLMEQRVERDRITVPVDART
jgi:hypothetical protein